MTQATAARKTRQDGIRTLADLHDRCKLDEETGCLMWAQSTYKGSACVCISGVKTRMSMGAALQLLSTGKPAEKGVVLVPTCGRASCATMKHRKPGTRSEMFAVLIPKLGELQRARIAAAHRARSKHYSPELRDEILSSSETGLALAARLGMHHSHISKIRTGECWRPAMASSVFAWRPA